MPETGEMTSSALCEPIIACLLVAEYLLEMLQNKMMTSAHVKSVSKRAECSQCNRILTTAQPPRKVLVEVLALVRPIASFAFASNYSTF